MFYSVRYVFAIYDNNIDFEEITDRIALKPTKIVRKGEKLASFLSAKSDGWIYSSEKGEWSKMYKPLYKMLDVLSDYSEFIKYAKGKYEQVGITFYISSEAAQIGFDIPNEIMQKINELNLNLWIEIFSYGMVEDE